MITDLHFFSILIGTLVGGSFVWIILAILTAGKKADESFYEMMFLSAQEEIKELKDELNGKFENVK